jgi:hypothetical protein
VELQDYYVAAQVEHQDEVEQLNTLQLQQQAHLIQEFQEQIANLGGPVGNV